jgi:hypothetical protein
MRVRFRRDRPDRTVRAAPPACARAQVTVLHRGVHDVPLPAGVRYIHGRLAPRELTHPEPDVVVHMWALIS